MIDSCPGHMIRRQNLKDWLRIATNQRSFKTDITDRHQAGQKAHVHSQPKQDHQSDFVTIAAGFLSEVSPICLTHNPNRWCDDDIGAYVLAVRPRGGPASPTSKCCTRLPEQLLSDEKKYITYRSDWDRQWNQVAAATDFPFWIQCYS